MSMLGTVAVLTTSTAAASAGGCTRSNVSIASCVGVKGTGTFVETVAGGVHLGVRKGARGYSEIYLEENGPGGRQLTQTLTTPEENHVNESYWHYSESFTDYMPVKRDLPSGSQVCSSFFERQDDGTVRKLDRACVDVG